MPKFDDKRIYFNLSFLLLLILGISACAPAPQISEAEQTATFEVAFANALETNQPADTPQPTDTNTATPTLPPTVTQTPTITPSPTAWVTDAERETALTVLKDYCFYNRKTGGVYYELDEIPFYTDISRAVQLALPGEVSVRSTCNYDPGNSPMMIMLHTTGTLQNTNSTVQTFQGFSPGTSAHYIVGRDGSVIQMVPEAYIAHHVACPGDPEKSCFPNAPGVYDANGNFIPPQTRSIGIEIANAGPLVYPRGTEGPLTDKFGIEYESEVEPYFYEGPYTDQYKYEYWETFPQVQLDALTMLIEDIQSRWPIELIVTHDQIQYKIDPGPALWEYRAQLGQP